MASGKRSDKGNRRNSRRHSRRSSSAGLPSSRRVGADYYGGYIEIAETGNTCYIKVVGLGSLSNGTPLRTYIQDAKQRKFREFIFDMAECRGMDSSFMGLIAGLAMDMDELPGGMGILVNLDEYNRGLLRQLGLLEFIDEGEVEIPPDLEWFRLDPGEATALDRARLAYDAHEKLIRIRPENKNRFYSFLKKLGQELLPFMRDDEDEEDKKR
ncbi:MAG: STAS domain-containing protein [Planctomycetota bacterium]|nr:STAS domain-containing protein [Planctomycetota bacterium]